MDGMVEIDANAADKDMTTVLPGTRAFFQEVRGLPVDELREFLDQHERSFEQSEVHDVADEKNKIDVELRNSVYRRLDDAVLFDMLEEFVSALNRNDEYNHYHLKRNDVTHIKYEKGGFFHKHRDYLSLTSNVIEEHAFLMCVTPEQLATTQGGQTVLHFSNGKYVSDATTIPGCGLSFRKDIQHESLVLQGGGKHILMLNLWGYRKHAPRPQLLQVLNFSEFRSHLGWALGQFSCESSSEVELFTDPDQSLDATGRQWQNGPSYMIPVSDVMALGSCRMSDFVREENAQAASSATPAAAFQNLDNYSSSESMPAVLRYDVSAQDQYLDEATGEWRDRHTYSEWATLYRIIRRAYVYPSELQERSALIRHHKLDKHHVLVNDADEDVRVPTALPCRFRQNEVILCESEARADEVAAEAVRRRLPFVPFRVLMVEGELHISGDTSRPQNRHFHMEPMFVTLGHYNHVYATGQINENWTDAKRTRTIGGATAWYNDPDTDWTYPSNPCLFGLRRRLVRHPDVWRRVVGYVFGDAKHDDPDASGSDVDGEGYGDGAEDTIHSLTVPVSASVPDIQERTDYYANRQFIKDRQAAPHVELRKSNRTVKRAWKGFAMATQGMENGRGREIDGAALVAKVQTKARVLQRAVKTQASLASKVASHRQQESNREWNPGAKGQRLFHIDASGKTSFTEAEAKLASEAVKRLDLLGQVRQGLNKVQLNLPQKSETVDATFCNERVYGHVNVVLVPGVLRLSPTPLGAKHSWWWTFLAIAGSGQTSQAIRNRSGAPYGGLNEDVLRAIANYTTLEEARFIKTHAPPAQQ